MRTYIMIAGLMAILFFSAKANAQLAWAVDSVADTVGNTVIVPVKVSGFDQVVSMQGTLTFDPGIITYTEVSSFGLSGLGTADFGGNTANGKLTFSWFDGGLGGQSLPDSTTVFAMSFDLIGSMGTSSSITFGNDPVSLEFVDTGFANITATYTSGAVSILDTSSSMSSFESAQIDLTKIEVYPNPFNNAVTVAF